MTNDRTRGIDDSAASPEITRRRFLQCSAWAFAAVPLSSLVAGCAGRSGAGDILPQPYLIDPNVKTTLERMLSFPPAKSPGLTMRQLDQVHLYSTYGYGRWTYGSGLPAVSRLDIMPAGYQPPPTHNRKLLRFFAFTDIHITDKEAPNQLIYLQQYEQTQNNNTSIYSPVMMYTTQVLDAAIQTVNVLHRQDPFDFGISLGDTCNNTSYNELRWYLDVIDGKVIHPSSGAHVGAESIDYQKPFRAVGLDPAIPWYQAIGNHDHFYIGSIPVDADPALGLRESYTAGIVWNVANALQPHLCNFPQMVNLEELKGSPRLYMGVFDGTSPYGKVIYTGAVTDPVHAASAPRVVADPNRRSLRRKEWVQEFFNTSTKPKGHGLNLVETTLNANGFACYSFVPNAKVPLKIIVLDDTQSEDDGSTDIHGHGYLDATRWAWLQSELAQGQASNQLMIIAAHCPIGVSAIGSETEWWGQTEGIDPQYQNAVSLTNLVRTLWNTPNLLMWIAGHRHLNVVKAFKPFDPPGPPEQAFWQVETSSLRDWPQQFRTFDIYLNSDYSISIVATNVDPSVAEGTPAAASRTCAIAVQQITRNNMNVNYRNRLTSNLGCGSKPLPTMDPSRIQTDQDSSAAYDASIQFVDMTQSRFPLPVPVTGSYNGQLLKQLSPQMVAVLKGMFPPPN